MYEKVHFLPSPMVCDSQFIKISPKMTELPPGEGRGGLQLVSMGFAACSQCPTSAGAYCGGAEHVSIFRIALLVQ